MWHFERTVLYGTNDLVPANTAWNRFYEAWCPCSLKDTTFSGESRFQFHLSHGRTDDRIPCSYI